MALLRVGFTKPARHRTAGALLPHLFTLTSRTAPSKKESKDCRRGGIFSVALSLGLPPVGVTHHPALWSPDFPPRSQIGATTQPTPATQEYSRFTRAVQGKNHDRSKFWNVRPAQSAASGRDVAGHDKERLTEERLVLRPEAIDVVELVDIDGLLVSRNYLNWDFIVASVPEADEAPR